MRPAEPRAGTRTAALLELERRGGAAGARTAAPRSHPRDGMEVDGMLVTARGVTDVGGICKTHREWLGEVRAPE